MSLWGNNDNKLSDGTVTVNHANLTVIGSGTTFGSVGCGATGDIIRFGQPLAGSTGYLGEAVIVAIGGTQSIVIDSICLISSKIYINPIASDKSSVLSLSISEIHFLTI